MVGFFNIRKPPGPTSHDVVDAVRRVAGPGGKVGHAGTLDPFAQGVLVICVGKATRLADYVRRQRKRYRARVILGAVSSTDDPTGEISASPLATAQPPRKLVERTLARFVGEIQQAPPAYSAVHVGGRRAYEFARRGKPVDLAPRAVTVHSIELLRYDYPDLELDVRCGSGTYIRALARDIGAALGVGGYCAALVRTEVGPFVLAKAAELESLDPRRDLIKPLDGLAGMTAVRLDAEQARKFTNGNGVMLTAPAAVGEAAVTDELGTFIGIGLVQTGGRALAPDVVFPP